MKTVPLRGKYGKGKFVLVDSGDFGWVSKRSWNFHKKGNDFYAACSWGDLHRLLIRAKRGEIVDHVNRNTLDCRKSNLRITDAGGNTKNVGLRKDNSSNYKGVNFWITGKRWTARIQVDGKRLFLGYFDTAKQAAKIYNLASKKHHKEFAFINPC